MISSILLLAASLQGVWAGDQTIVTFTAKGARIEQGCADGTISVPVRLDRHRRFSATGTYDAQKPGPQLETDEGPPPAIFSGKIVGQTLRLTIRPLGGAEHTYTLQQDAKMKLLRCY